MSPSPSWIRAVFCLAVGLVAAAVTDPLVERLSNAGLFGHGIFTDRSNLDVVPALAVGALAATVWAIACIVHVLRAGGSTAHPGWLGLSADALDARTIVRLVPVIFAMQLCALFLMETLEQIAVAGHPLGGALWLGGPIAFSLGAHAFSCITATAIFGRALHAFVRTFARLVWFICDLVTALTADASTKPLPLQPTGILHRAAFVFCRIGERAPPTLCID